MIYIWFDSHLSRRWRRCAGWAQTGKLVLTGCILIPQPGDGAELVHVESGRMV